MVKPEGERLQFTTVRVRKGVVLGLVVGAIGILLRPTDVGLRLEEEVGLPWLFAMRGPRRCRRRTSRSSASTGSAQQFGMDTTEWPPPRDVSTPASSAAANRHSVSVIVMDVWFERHRSPEDDDDLARAMAESGNVVLVQRLDRPSVPGAGVSTQLLQSPIVQFQQSAVSLAPFPLPSSSSSSLTSFFWPFFETATGTVATLPSAALQVHALPVSDRLLLSLGQAGREAHQPIAEARDLCRRTRDSLMQVLRRELQSDPQAAKRALARLEAGAASGLSATETAVLSAL